MSDNFTAQCDKHWWMAYW